jgi:Zn-dependent metalloprotease
MVKSEDSTVREAAAKTIATSAALRARRVTLAGIPGFAGTPSPTGSKYRLVYDAQRRYENILDNLVRQEGQDQVTDEAVNEAYENAGITYDFYNEVFGRNSIDAAGMALVSVVHYGEDEDNAFWTGDKMLYCDGGIIFGSTTQDIDVAAHEFTHGVIQYESRLEYRDQSGALNESFADVFGILTQHRFENQPVEGADWWLGGDILAPALKDRGIRGIRTLTKDKAYENDPLLGTDRQPKHMRDLYKGTADRGGVHINSGIPNHAFYLVATELGGNAWESAGAIWYKTLRALSYYSNFEHAAEMSYQIAGADYGINSREQQAVGEAWAGVGLTVEKAQVVA